MTLRELQKPTPWAENKDSGCIVSYGNWEIECSGETHGEQVQRRNAGPRICVPDGAAWQSIFRVDGVDHVTAFGVGKADPGEMDQIFNRVRDEGSQKPPMEPAKEI